MVNETKTVDSSWDSTRGEIGMLLENGSVISIYNEYDSYIKGLGTDLYLGVRDKDVERLILNQPETDLMMYASIKEYAHEGLDDHKAQYLYIYVFTEPDPGWYVCSNDTLSGTQTEVDEDDKYTFYKLEDNDSEVYANKNVILEDLDGAE